MQSIKFGVVVCGLLGLVGCFLPLTADAPPLFNLTLFDTRNFDAANFYVIAGGFAAALAMGAMGVAKGMQRWMSIIAIVGFSVVLLRMRGEVLELLRAGIGAKLMGVGVLAGLALAILTTVKPEPVNR